MIISFKHTGNFKHLEKFLANATNLNIQSILQKYGQQGISALASATPKDTGLTAQSWDYTISKTPMGYSLSWINSSITNTGIPIVILLQYGHGTRNGAYVQGQDFINPAIKPILDRFSQQIWEEVSKL